MGSWITFIFFLGLLHDTFVACQVKNPPSESCDSIYRSEKDVWLLGESPSAPFAAQLHSIFSYAPVTFVFQSHLVVGDLIGHASRSNDSKSNEWTEKRIPFSQFFDSNHFTWYWTQHRLKVISQKFYDGCFVVKNRDVDVPIVSKNRVHRLINITRIPEFFPYANDEFRKLLYYSNTTSNSTFIFPFPNHSLVKVKSRFNMVGFYNFWGNLPMLNYVYSSLRPAMPIEKFSQALYSLLPVDFVSVHVRVDDEAFGSLENNQRLENDQRVTRKIVQYIKDASCFQSLSPKEPASSLPTVYLSTNAKPQNKAEKRRVKRIVEELSNVGFQNVVTRKILYDRHARKKMVVPSQSLEGIQVLSLEDALHGAPGGARNDLSLMKSFSPEQLSYVDMIINRKSKCFVPSLVPSLASYITMRYRQFDSNLFESYDQINQKTYGDSFSYRDYGW